MQSSSYSHLNNSSDSHTVGDYTDNYESRVSSEPMYPSAQKLQTNYTTTSIDLESNMTRVDQQKEEVPKKKLTFLEKANNIFRVMKPMLTIMLFDVGLPLAIYYILKNYVGVLIALVLSGIPPLLHVIYTFWRHRKVDIMGCIILFSFILSAVLSLITGNVRVALLRDSTTTALIGFVFLITLIPLRTRWFEIRPLVFLIASSVMAATEPITWIDKDGNHQSMKRMDWIWEYCRIFRRYCYILSATWGVLLLGEFTAKVIMIEGTSLTVDQIVLYGNIIVIVVMVVMTIVSAIASRFIRKRCMVIEQEFHRESDFSEQFASK